MGILSPKQDGGRFVRLLYINFIHIYFKTVWCLMNEQRRDFDGSSIYGQKLKIHFKGDGVLSSSFVIERSKKPLLPLVFIFLPCVIAVVAAVCQVRTMSRMLCVCVS